MRVLFNIVAFLFIVSFSVAKGADVLPPEQPDTGPGGKDYLYRSVKVTQYGRNDNKYYIFEPVNYKQRQAPVVAFIHGWIATDPSTYRLWIDHIVKKGNIVIYPVYQRIITGPDYFTFYAATALKDAFKKLYTRPKHIRPDINKFAIFGHSAGGLIAANLAAIAANDITMPKPTAILSVEPGITSVPPGSMRSERENANPYTVIPLLDLRKISPETYLITIVGDEDKNVFDYDAKRIYNETINVPYYNKDYVIMHSDYYGNPPLIADHYAPVAAQGEGNPLLTMTLKKRDPELYERLEKRKGADALDFYCMWKLGDILLDIAFNKRDFQNLNGSEIESYMGKWSDGTPVKELTIYSDELPN
jgi:acetyl esterase/lipase